MGRKRDKNRVLIGVTIESIAAEGKCVARVDDQVVFVTGVAPGDVADIQVTKKRKGFLEGKPVHFHQYSPDRVTPFCTHFGICGGCKWQHIPYELQLQYKQQQVADHFERIAKVAFPPVQPILAAADTTFYRNKLEFTFSNMGWLTREEIESGEALDRNALGFHIPGQFDKIIHVDTCHLQPAPSNDIRLAVKDYCQSHGMPFYDLRKKEGQMRNLIIRTTLTGEVMVTVQAAYEDEKLEGLLHHLQSAFPVITSLQYVINNKGNETFHDLEVKCFAGTPYITETMEGLHFRIGPKSFYQTNAKQAYELYKITRDFAGLTGEEVVYDLYTGTGTIANFVAKDAKKVIGIEYVPAAIEDAKINSKINAIDNTLFYAGDMKDLLTDQFMESHERA